MLYTLAEAAEYLRVSERFLRNEIKAGRLRAMKAGVGPSSPIRIRREWLRDYERQQTVKPQAS